MTPFVIITGYAVLGLAAIAIQVFARRPGARLHPARTCLAAVMHSAVGRWIVLVLWAWTGWHFFVR